VSCCAPGSGGLADGLNHFGHGEGLARAGYAQQDLMLFAFAHTARELGDGVLLISARLVVHRQPESMYSD